MRVLCCIGLMLAAPHIGRSQDVVFRQHLRQPDRYSFGVFVESMWLQTQTGLVPLEWKLDSVQIDFNQKTGRNTYYRWIKCKKFIVPKGYCPTDSAKFYCNLGKHWVVIQFHENHFDLGAMVIEMIEYRWPFRASIFGGWRYGYIINGSYSKAKRLKRFSN